MPTHDVLARMAWERGQAALSSGEAREAARWLDRAHRLAPDDPTVRLALASALLGLDAARAEALFAGLVEGHDVREVQLGLAAACWRLGDLAGAAVALARGLSRHVAPPDDGWVALADAIAPDGWCAVATDGGLVTGPSLGRGTTAGLELALDGQASRGPRLPRHWRDGRRLDVARNGRVLIGSPIDVTALVRVEGLAAWRDGTLAGWAWHPGDPGRPVTLSIHSRQGRPRRVVADDAMSAADGAALLARPRGFILRLPASSGPVVVRGDDGQALAGSPVETRDVPAAHPAAAPPGAVPRRRQIAIVIPVHDGADATAECLQSVLRARPQGASVIVVDDGSRDTSLVAALEGEARRGRIRLIRHPESRGFPAAANAGLAAAGGRDVLLLNSDTLVAPGFAERLRNAAYAAPDIATACPLSNNATILSYPIAGAATPMPDFGGTCRMDALAARANAGRIVSIPTPVGFCMFMRHDAVARVGAFRADVFGRGYGEENDLAMRARGAGWRHVAVPGVFVAHAGGASFGALAPALRQRAQEILSRLHPHYPELIAAHRAADPLADARRRLDMARWRAARPRRSRALLLLTHAKGGGVARAVAERCAALRCENLRPIVLRPAPGGGDGCLAVDDGSGAFPNLRFSLPREMPALMRFLRSENPERMELHHLLGHVPEVLDLPRILAIPYDAVAHDHGWFCPRLTLSGDDGRYCGEPELAGCEACVAQRGSRLETGQSVAQLRRQSSGILRRAVRVIVPGADIAARVRRHFPRVRTTIVPPEADAGFVPAPAPGGNPRRVVVIGAIGAEKGFHVLRAAGQDAAARRLDLEFVLVGHSVDDVALMETGKIFVTGLYHRAEAVALIRAQHASLALLPSIVPETWCYALSEAWEAGLRVAAFDLGEQAGRIRRTGRGILFPLGLPATALNDALLAAC